MDGMYAVAALAGMALAATEPSLNQMARDLLEAAGMECTIAGVRALPRDRLLAPHRRTVRRGWFDRSTRVLYVALEGRHGEPLPRGVVAGVLVHELAHACLGSGAHTGEWRAMYVRLLRVATESLGWHVRLEAGSCRLYGVCGAWQCPRCAFS